MKFNSPEFFLPFSYHLPKLWTDWFAHVNGKKKNNQTKKQRNNKKKNMFLVSLVNEITLTGPAQHKKSLSGMRCRKIILHGTMRNDDF